MKSTCEYSTWTVNTLAEKIEQKQINLPKFQRSVVWNDERQKKLIGSIRQGFPIGALLLYKSANTTNGIDRYSIIDGLQRTTAIIKYLKSQTTFIGNSDADILPEWQSFGMWVVQTFTGTTPTNSETIDLIHRFISEQTSVDIDRMDFCNFVVARFPSTSIQAFAASDELKSRFEDFKSSVKQSLDIRGANVPVIIFEGDESLLPEIFERLNSHGVPLNKYQIFAATWRDECQIQNPEVVEAIKQFYMGRLQDSSLEIDDIDVDGMPTELTLFDYLTGLGSVLTKKFPVLFDENWSDFIAFQIATVAHKLPIGSMRQLPNRFQRNNDALIATDAFTDALLASCEIVSTALKGRLSLKLNSSETAEFAGHSAFQIDSIVTLILLDGFTAMSWVPKESQFGSLNIEQYIRRWYLIDRLKDVWGNAGDSQYFRYVWTQPDSESDYIEVVADPTSNTVEQLGSALDNWFNDQMTRRDRSRKNVTRDTRLVLRYFYYNILSVGDEDENFFHVDHIVPVSWWSGFFKKFADSAGPINSIGNLCLMIDRDNSHKKKKLPLRWFNERTANPDDPQFSSRCINKYFLIEPTEFGYPELASPIDQLNQGDISVREAVLNGLDSTSKKRWAIMKKGISESLAD